MAQIFIDKGDKIKILTISSGTDVKDIVYCDKDGLMQKVASDVLTLFYEGDESPKVTVTSPDEFKDVNGGTYNSWDEVTDFLQGLIDSPAATNAIDVSVNTTLDTSNMVANSINVVYVTTSSLAILLDLDSSLVVGTIINVKDISGAANTNNVTISGSSQTVDRVTSLALNVNCGSYTIVKKSSTEWYILSGLI